MSENIENNLSKYEKKYLTKNLDYALTAINQKLLNWCQNCNTKIFQLEIGPVLKNETRVICQLGHQITRVDQWLYPVKKFTRYTRVN